MFSEKGFGNSSAFKCTICHDVPGSPIHNCSNGHIVCGICSDSMTECGQCQTELQISILGEHLSRELKFESNCPINYNARCRIPILSTQLKEHIPVCYYRDVACNDWGSEDCKNKLIPIGDFVNHLIQTHGFQEQTGAFTNTIVNELEDYSCWPKSFTTSISGLEFLIHNLTIKNVVFFWTTVLAGKEEAAKHTWELTLESFNGNEMPKCTWTLPVYPYHDFPAFDETPQGLFAAIPAKVLKEYSEKNVVANNTEYIFQLSHRVHEKTDLKALTYT